MNLVNFRDLGGIETIDGKKVKTKRLLRAGEPVKMNGAAVTMLINHKLSAIADFRSAREIASAPVDKLPGVSYINFDIMADQPENAASEEDWLKRLHPDYADKHMIDLYRDFITSQSGRSGYSQFTKYCINNNEGAILFHCAAGKDRTGFGAALILKLLGVSDEDVFHDYLKTIEARKESNEKIVENYRTKGLTEDQLSALAMLYSVKRAYLEATFETIQAEYGSFDAYIENGLMITPAEIERLRELYLE